jgi:hypothetical protein
MLPWGAWWVGLRDLCRSTATMAPSDRRLRPRLLGHGGKRLRPAGPGLTGNWLTSPIPLLSVFRPRGTRSRAELRGQAHQVTRPVRIVQRTITIEGMSSTS